MKKKKICAFMLSVMLAAAAVTGCGSSQNKAAPSGSDSTVSSVSSPAGTAADTAAAVSEAEVSAPSAESAAEAPASSVAEAVAVPGTEAPAASDAEAPASSIAEAVASSGTEALASSAASAAENVLTDNLPSDDKALAETWRQITDAFVSSYTPAYESYEAMKNRQDQKAAFRISIDPDAIKLLGLASETFLNMDLSWVDDISIDVVSLIEEYEQAQATGFSSGVPEYTMFPYASPGFSAILHVNGKEILSADALIDECNQALRIRLPELVSGEYADMEILDSFFSAYRNTGLTSGSSFYGAGGGPFTNQLQTANAFLAVLPDPELLRSILETAGQLFEDIETVSEDTLLEAGAVSENCRRYTGSLPAAKLIRTANLLMDRFENDAAFHDDVVAYLDSYYEEYRRNPYLQSMVSSLTAGDPSLYFLNPTAAESTLNQKVALLTGEWDFREGAYEAALAALAESADGTADSSAESTSSDSSDNFYQLTQITAEPGRPMSLDEYESLPYDQQRLLQMAFIKGDIELTGDLTFGGKLAVLYEYYADSFRNAIEEAAAQIPEKTDIEIGSFLNMDGQLRGLSLAQAEKDSYRRPLADIAWPENDDHHGFSMKLYDSAYGSEMISVLAEDLHDSASGKQDFTASCGMYGMDVFSAAFNRDPDEGEWNLTADITVPFVNEKISFSAELKTDPADESETLTVNAADSLNSFEPFTLTLEKSPEGTKDIWSGNAVTGEMTIGTLTGSYDRANGETDFLLDISVDEYETYEVRLLGAIDPESGDGKLDLTFSSLAGRGGVFSPGLRTNSKLTVTICTEKLKAGSDGAVSGKLSLSAETGGENPDFDLKIPKGLMLICDFEEKALKVGDESGTYLSVRMLEESEYMSFEEAHARIKDMAEASAELRYALAAGRSTSFKDDWNILLPLNRLLKAGMPEDFLKEAAINGTPLSELLADQF